MVDVFLLGRQGKPKKRLLRCDTGMLRLYWGEVPDTKALKSTIADVAQDLPSENKSIELLEAIEVRRATEEDSDDVSTVAGTAVTSGPGTASAAAAGKYGTKILRRNKLKPEELSLSFSIILKDRSFDIQCLNEADFRFLYINILHYWKMMSNK